MVYCLIKAYRKKFNDTNRAKLKLKILYLSIVFLVSFAIPRKARLPAIVFRFQNNALLTRKGVVIV